MILLPKNRGPCWQPTRIGKHMFFSCRDRWHDTRIDGNGCFELHIGSKFHEIELQKMDIPNNWGRSLSPQKQTHCQQRNRMLKVSINSLLILSWNAKQATRTLHENSRLALDHGLPAMPSSNRHLFWHFHRRSPQAKGEGRRKNLGTMAVGPTMADVDTVLLLGMIWTDSK